LTEFKLYTSAFDVLSLWYYIWRRIVKKNTTFF